MNVNFTSQALVIKTFISSLKQKRSGNVIVIGSEAGLNGAKKGSIYCASKFALRGFCQSLRHECSNANVAVTLINPGMVNTEFFNSLNFAPADPTQHALQVDSIVETVEMVLKAKRPTVLEEINLQAIQKVLAMKQIRTWAVASVR